LSGTFNFDSKGVNCKVLQHKNTPPEIIYPNFPSAPYASSSNYFKKGSFTLFQNGCESIDVELDPEEKDMDLITYSRPLTSLLPYEGKGFVEKVSIWQALSPKLEITWTIDSSDMMGKSRETTTWIFQLDQK